MSARHRKEGKPTTGDGRKGGRKPQRLEVTQQTASGTILWRATAALFGGKKKGGNADKK